MYVFLIGNYYAKRRIKALHRWISQRAPGISFEERQRSARMDLSFETVNSVSFTGAPTQKDVGWPSPFLHPLIDPEHKAIIPRRGS